MTLAAADRDVGGGALAHIECPRDMRPPPPDSVTPGPPVRQDVQPSLDSNFLTENSNKVAKSESSSSRHQSTDWVKGTTVFTHVSPIQNHPWNHKAIFVVMPWSRLFFSICFARSSFHNFLGSIAFQIEISSFLRSEGYAALCAPSPQIDNPIQGRGGDPPAGPVHCFFVAADVVVVVVPGKSLSTWDRGGFIDSAEKSCTVKGGSGSPARPYGLEGHSLFSKFLSYEWSRNKPAFTQ